jgi:hypothetical protein
MKRTFAAKFAGVRDELVVQLDERAGEQLAEGVRHLLAGSLYVGGDRLRLGDHLVAEAGVELHVARLVDLLGCEEGRLLLRGVRGDKARELGRDALLGDHQRGQREVDDLAEARLQLWPLLTVGRQVDLERAPLLVLPAAVERLRVIQLDLAHTLVTCRRRTATSRIAAVAGTNQT